MNFVAIRRLEDELHGLQADFNRKPFRFLVIDDFFHPEMAEALLAAYPSTKDGAWDHTTYIDQRNKFQKTVFEQGSIMEQAFHELNSPELLHWLSKLTGIEHLIADPKLFGGGLHQSTRGAFLNVHVDYNVHPETKHHRRLNLLVYMNKAWKQEYEGYLELWDMAEKKQIANIEPLFNRCVIFETNEISFHGHPKPLNTPDGISRKSIATYYYSEHRPADEIAPEHNTIYVNTDGVNGVLKRLSSGVKAFLERINKR